MSWVITGTQKEPAGDSFFFSNVSLLLHGDGTNGSTTITDSSSRMNTVTANGNAQISTAQSKFGGASIAFDGIGDFLSLNGSEDFSFGTNDFTIEFWVRPAVTISSNVILYETRASPPASGSVVIYINNARKPIIFIQPTGNVLTGSTSLDANTWYHLAAVKAAGSYYLYVNGVSDSSPVVNSLSVPQPVTVRIGIDFATSGGLNGYIDEFRITKGVARYTANFTPPTAPFPDI
jgi:hypothetical protein